MKYLENFESLSDRLLKKQLDRHLDNFNKEKNKQKPVSIKSTITGKDIIYNPFNREILNDDNVSKYVVLKDYPFDIDQVELNDRAALTSFICNSIGQIIKASLGGGLAYYDIKYYNVPENLNKYFTPRHYDNDGYYLIASDFDFISDNYGECETFITANKYNI